MGFGEGGGEELRLQSPELVLCTSVSEEGGDGHGAASEVLSLLSYTRNIQTHKADIDASQMVCETAPSILKLPTRIGQRSALVCLHNDVWTHADKHRQTRPFFPEK